MASSNPIILSSSAPTSYITTTPPRNFAAALSSSPSLPSPSELFTRGKPSMKDGCSGLALSAAAVNGFTSASSLLALAKDVTGSTVSAQFAVASQAHHPSQESLKTTMKYENAPAHDGVVAVQVRKLGAPRKKSMAQKKHLSEAIVRDSDEEEPEIIMTTLAKKPNMPHNTTTGGAKQHSEVMARDGNIENVIIDGLLPTKKPKAQRKKLLVMDKQSEGAVDHDCRNEAPTIEMTVVKKRRAKGTIDEGQTKIKKGKIVKPAASGDQGLSLKNGKADVKRKGHRVTASEFVSVEDVFKIETYEPLGLDMAMTRRKSWTPVKESYGNAGDRKAVRHDTSSPFKDTSFTHDTQPTTSNGTLLGSYSYCKDSEAEVSRPTAFDNSGEAPTKKRKIDFVGTPVYPSLVTKAIKQNKAPKPKPQTITGKATAPFISENAATASPLLQYLAPQSIAEKSSPVPVDRLIENPTASKHARKCPAKLGKSDSVRRKAHKVTPVLLPPEEALEATADQDLLFGTSSQLIREGSPTFIRDLQKALKASESFIALTDIEDVDTSFAAVQTESSIIQRTSTRNLWSEAARDSQGSLMEPEIIDLVDTPKACILTKQDETTKPVTTVDSVSKPSAEKTSEPGIDPFAEPILKLGTETIPRKPATSKINCEIDGLVPSIPRSVAEAALRSRPRSRSPSKKLISKSDQKTDMPSFQDLTISELSRTISKYGFKPIKGKAAMVALLQKCWESKNRPVLQSIPPNLNIPSLASNEGNTTINIGKTPSPVKRKGRPPKVKDKALPVAQSDHPSAVSADPVTKPRGRPRKETLPPLNSDAIENESGARLSSTIRKEDALFKKARNRVLPLHDDIEDPNPPPTPSPPRRRSPPSPPQALSLATPATLNALCSIVPSTNVPDNIYEKISQAITTFPPTHDPKNLTWHEKILLYDPVILEDLALWLNTEGLGRVGVDEEVGPITVRSWCEGRGICCLWRKNLRGGARKRY